MSPTSMGSWSGCQGYVPHHSGHLRWSQEGDMGICSRRYRPWATPRWCRCWGPWHHQIYTVYPKKYAHGFCFAVLCCGYTLTDFPISIRLTSLALWQSDDCPSASKAILMNMDKYFIWIHYERLHNHNKTKHNKTVCIFFGIYCTWRKTTAEELQNTVNQVQVTSCSQRSPSSSIPAKLRRAGITVCSEKPTLPPVADTTYEECMATLQEGIHRPSLHWTNCTYEDISNHTSVRHRFSTNVATMHPGTLPLSGPSRGTPPEIEIWRHHRRCGPVRTHWLVLNVVISEMKPAGDIRINIDARPLNVGAKHTKYHVTTPQEVRHLLDGATVFSEMDIGNVYHQVPLAPEPQVVFRTHKGLHRMKRLFFGPKNSSGIFHHEVRKAFTCIDGCITIYDNILVYCRDGEEHNRNQRATLQWANEKGITFKLSKSAFCAPEVTWFGRVFSAAGVSADPEKIQTITGAGRPENIEDVKSLLQAAAYNAKFAYDHQEAESYEKVTAPLRELLMKEATFSSDDRREESFLKLLKMMNDKSILTPFIIGHPTHLVTDASPHGISASLYQEDDSRRWLPIDHISRALSRHEQGWKSQIEWESLAKMWGMTMFRPYLVGTKFTSWGDHQPLLSFYNNLTEPATARITKHRYKIMDLTFTDKYLHGKKMPGDYNSRHPAPITHLNSKERATLLMDDGMGMRYKSWEWWWQIYLQLWLWRWYSRQHSMTLYTRNSSRLYNRVKSLKTHALRHTLQCGVSSV